LLNEREFELINTLASEIPANQRDLSTKMNISLGMVNMLIRRLITKGYLRTSKLKANRIGYILTPQGLSEKMKQSIRYTKRTLGSIGAIKQQLKKIFDDLYQANERNFVILGETDLALLADMAAMERGAQDCSVIRMASVPTDNAKIDAVVLVCEEELFAQVNADKKIDVVHELAKGHVV
jgi:DNA-binding MarR family transcriptional regulator